jgi:hypothetical protein
MIVSLIIFIVCAATCVHSKQGNRDKKCVYLPDNLIGRCWGLTGIEEKHFDWTGVTKREVNSAEGCEELCCEMADACITYQFREREKKCLIGKHVRLGKEAGNTPLWCEPLPPAKWNGRKRSINTESSSPEDLQRQRAHKCEWGEHLPRQCWHLGPERLNATGGRMGPKACAMGCRTKNCIAWQQLPDRGCFYNDEPMRELHCDKNDEAYVGKRKKHAV